MVSGITAFSNATIQILDWLVEVAERTTALAVAVLVGYLSFHFLFGKATPSDVQFVSAIGAHWQALLILLIPLFYRTIRTFLQEVEEAYGMKRRSMGGIQSEQDESRESK